jgi:hypothetical protein
MVSLVRVRFAPTNDAPHNGPSLRSRSKRAHPVAKRGHSPQWTGTLTAVSFQGHLDNLALTFAASISSLCS